MIDNYEIQTETIETLDEETNIIFVDEITYKVYSNGRKDVACSVRYPKPDDNVEYEPTETELIQAELLLNQIDIIAKQNEQDEVLAEILLNQMGV